MAVVLVAVLYFAWLVSWGGTFATTCTMGDYKSLKAAMVMSSVFYLGALAALPRMRLGAIGVFLSLPLSFLVMWQAIWGMRLFLVLNVDGRSACSLMFGGDYGPAQGGWSDLVLPSYYIMVSLGSLAALAAAHWRYRRPQEPELSADVFD